MPPPVPDATHTEDFEQLAALAALRVLDGDELEAFEAHAAHCERCRAMTNQDKRTLSSLSLAAPEMDPSPGFRARLMERAAAELRATAQAPAEAAAPPAEAAAPPAEIATPREPVRFEPRPRAPITPLPFWRRTAWATPLAAAVALLIGAGVFLAQQTYSNQVVATVALAGAGPGAGTVVVRRSGAAELQLQVPADPPSGFVYEAWIIPPGQAPIPAGTTSSGRAVIPLQGGPIGGSTVAVTLERAPGVQAPETTPFLAGTVGV
jgi:anti-sigma-K factor RskA